MKFLTHDADHGVVLTVKVDCLANDLRIGTEMALPQAVAQHDFTVMSGLIFFRNEGTAELWLNS